MDLITENNGKIRWVSAGMLVVERPFYGAEKALIEQRDTARADLAASQARQKVLREQIELTTIGACSCGTKTPDARYHSTYCVYSRLVAILALPADDTALREMLVEAQEEMRERCIEEVRAVGGIGAIEVERLIRALEVKR